MIIKFKQTYDNYVLSVMEEAEKEEYCEFDINIIEDVIKSAYKENETLDCVVKKLIRLTPQCG